MIAEWLWIWVAAAVGGSVWGFLFGAIPLDLFIQLLLVIAEAAGDDA